MLLMKLSKLSPPLLPVQSYSPADAISGGNDQRLMEILTNDEAFSVVACELLLRVDADAISAEVKLAYY